MILDELKLADGTETAVAIPLFLAYFNKFFQKNGYENFKIYLTKNRKIKKWMILSDYVFDDKEKQNDVVTFSFIPHMWNFKDFRAFARRAFPHDITNVTSVSQEFLKFLRNAPIYNISIILTKNRPSVKVGEKDVIKKQIEMFLRQISIWEENTPEGLDYYQKLKKGSMHY